VRGPLSTRLNRLMNRRCVGPVLVARASKAVRRTEGSDDEPQEAIFEELRLPSASTEFSGWKKRWPKVWQRVPSLRIRSMIRERRFKES
jgi:hypothetical protein